MRTELVPYVTIVRITIRGEPASEGRIGFDVGHEVQLLAGPSNLELTP